MTSQTNVSRNEPSLATQAYNTVTTSGQNFIWGMAKIFEDPKRRDKVNKIAMSSIGLLQNYYEAQNLKSPNLSIIQHDLKITAGFINFAKMWKSIQDAIHVKADSKTYYLEWIGKLGTAIADSLAGLAFVNHYLSLGKAADNIGNVASVNQAKIFPLDSIISTITSKYGKIIEKLSKVSFVGETGLAALGAFATVVGSGALVVLSTLTLISIYQENQKRGPDQQKSYWDTSMKFIGDAAKVGLTVFKQYNKTNYWLGAGALSLSLYFFDALQKDAQNESKNSK